MLYVFKRNSHAYGTYWPSFQSPFLENMGVFMNNKGYQMIQLFILLQLIQVLKPGSNLINFYEDQKEVGVRKSISHKWGMIRNFKLKMEEQETAKDGMAGLQSGNKIWEDWPRTSLNAMVNLRYCMTLTYEWTMSRSQKLQQNLRRSTENKLKCEGLPTCNIL